MSLRKWVTLFKKVISCSSNKNEKINIIFIDSFVITAICQSSLFRSKTSSHNIFKYGFTTQFDCSALGVG